MSTAAQFAGALCILLSFVLTQRRVLTVDTPANLWLNAVGSGVLFAIAVQTAMWGFALLEGAWFAVSLVGLLRRRGTASVDDSARR